MSRQVPPTCVFVRRSVRIRRLNLGLSAMLGWESLGSCRSDMFALPLMAGCHTGSSLAGGRPKFTVTDSAVPAEIETTWPAPASRRSA